MAVSSSGEGGLGTRPGGVPPIVHRLRKGALVAVSGLDEGRAVDIATVRCSGGRSIANDLVLQDSAVAGVHFDIVASDGGYLLRDLDSGTGTYIGDVRIREVYLSPGMVFRVGGTHIRFDLLPEEVEFAQQHRLDTSLVGVSAAMREIRDGLGKIARSELTCLITGETGAGKELVARAIHEASPRRGKPFVVLDCGSIPRELIESALFGHEKGAFTGAVGLHRGYFEQADGGTLFLDEVGELAIDLQPRLLRVLEEREIKRVGGSRTLGVDVRVLAATNRDLRAEVDAGNFREDLFFRLSVVHVEIPPLRQHRDDIPLLAQHFLDRAGARRATATSFDAGAMDALMAYPWPGNVRELRNVVERAVALCEGPMITRRELPFDSGSARAGQSAGQHPPGPVSASPAVGQDGPVAFAPALFAGGQLFKPAKQRVVDAFEVAYLRALMERNRGNITRSAQEAGLTRYHLRALLRRHQLA